MKIQLNRKKLLPDFAYRQDPSAALAIAKIAILIEYMPSSSFAHMEVREGVARMMVKLLNLAKLSESQSRACLNPSHEHV